MPVDNNTKLSSNGPFRGINLSLTPNKLGETEQLFCIEQFNLVVDPVSGELRSRVGTQEWLESDVPIIGISQYENINYQNYNKQEEIVLLTTKGLFIYNWNLDFLALSKEFLFDVSASSSVVFSEVSDILYFQISGLPLKRYDGQSVMDAGVIPGALIGENMEFLITDDLTAPSASTTGVIYESDRVLNNQRVQQYPNTIVPSIPTHKATSGVTQIPNRAGWFFKSNPEYRDHAGINDRARIDFAFSSQHLNKDGSSVQGDASSKFGTVDLYQPNGNYNYSILKTKPEYGLGMELQTGNSFQWTKEQLYYENDLQQFFLSKNKKYDYFSVGTVGQNNYKQLTELVITGGGTHRVDPLVTTMPITSGLSQIQVNEIVYFQAVLFVDYFRQAFTPTPEAVYTYPYKILVKASKKSNTEFNENIEYMMLPCSNAPYTGEWIRCTWTTMLNSKIVSYALTALPSQQYQYGLLLGDFNVTTSNLTCPATTGSFLKIYTRLLTTTVTSNPFTLESTNSLPFNELETMYLADIIPVHSFLLSGIHSKLDPYHLVPSYHLGPSTLLDNQQYLPDSLRYVYDNWASKFNYNWTSISFNPNISTLPEGKHLSVFQNRLWITDIKDAPNTAFASDVVYGVDMSSGSLADSLQIDNTIPGDKLVGSLNLGDSIALITQEALHLVQGDFASNTIRVDEVISGGFGCVNSRTICRTREGGVWLSEEGPVYLQQGAMPQFLGGGQISRVKKLFEKVNDLDFTRAWAYYDESDNSYNLFVRHQSNPSLDLNLRYDFFNDSFNTSDVKFVGSAITSKRRLFISNSTFFPSDMFFIKSYREGRNINDFLDLALDTSTRVIPFKYLSHFITFADASILKKIKFFRLISTGKYSSSVYNKFDFKVRIFKDYMNSAPSTVGTLKYAWNYLMGRVKVMTTKFYTFQYELTRDGNTTAPTTPSIQSIQIEAVPIYKNQEKPW